MDNAIDAVKMARSEGFDEAVSEFSEYRTAYLKITNSKIDSLVEKFSDSGNIFLSSKKRILFTNIQARDKKSTVSAISRAKTSIKLTVPKKDYYGIAQGPFKYSCGSGHDKKIENYDLGTVSDIACACIDAAEEEKVSKVAGAVFMQSGKSEMATSKNVKEEWRHTSARISMRFFGKISSVQEVVASRFISELKPEKFVRESVRLMNSVNKIGKIKAGTYDLIYLPSPGGSIISQVDAMAGMSVVETGSIFTKKLGKLLANKGVSIYDDGDMKNAVSARPFDNEGYPTQRTPVIKDGVLKNYLHNFSTAKKHRTKSTGNAGLVNPDANTTVLVHKKRVKNLDALIERVDKGIVITNLWYTRYANFLTGDFSTMPRDLAIYIEKGEPKFAIRQKSVSSMLGIRVSDNLIRMMKNIECVADDTRQSASWETDFNYYFMPSMLVRDAQVSVA